MKTALLTIVFATAAAAGVPAERFPTVDNAPLTWSTGPYSYDPDRKSTRLNSSHIL